MQEFRFEIIHIKGATNPTGFLSRGLVNVIDVDTEEKGTKQIEDYHTKLGHPSSKTQMYAMDGVKYRGLGKAIEEFIKRCEVCQRTSKAIDPDIKSLLYRRKE